MEAKIYLDDLGPEHTQAPSYTSPLTLLATVSARQIRLDTNAMPYETVVEVEVGQAELFER